MIQTSRRAFLQHLTWIAGAGLVGCGGSKPRVVLYCAQDREFAVDIVDDFTKETGLDVVPKFDTEANKSVGLYSEIVAERDRPRCDVFWNNEIVSTLRLQQQGLLASHESAVAQSYPSWARATDHTWHAFASRARVLIVNTKVLAEGERPRSLLDLADEKWRGKVVMAKPQFGTTATQMACLFEVLGSSKAKQYLLGLKENDVRLAPGNKQVAQWVAQGRTPSGQSVAIGMTDTDDAIIEVRAKRDVAIIFPDGTASEGRMGTLFIPNTLSIPKGCPNERGARQLIDYLLSPNIEKRLAEGPSAQIPLNPEVRADLPQQIQRPNQLRVMAVDWLEAAQLWDEAQEFVKKEFAVA